MSLQRNLIDKFQKDKNTPAQIVPVHSITTRTLILLIAIMTFLSCITLGGVILVQKSASAWSSDISREVTIQIRPIKDELMDANLRLAETIAQAADGVFDANALSIEQSEALIKPWLGKDIDLTELNIPRLIIVKISDSSAFDPKKLQDELKIIKGATLDTHEAWRDQLNTMATTFVMSGLLIFSLIVIATLLAVIFATRGTMASNREIVDVLHFIGASNRFVAKEFQHRFLKIGLKGGLIGGIGAVGFYLLISIFSKSLLPNASSEQLNILFGSFSLNIMNIIVILLIVPVIAILTALTSRTTVRKFLKQITW
jgi:cell division transport system permease protein